LIKVLKVIGFIIENPIFVHKNKNAIAQKLFKNINMI